MSLIIDMNNEIKVLKFICNSNKNKAIIFQTDPSYRYILIQITELPTVMYLVCLPACLTGISTSLAIMT